MTLIETERAVVVYEALGSAVDMSGGYQTSGQVAVVTPENRIEIRTVELGMQNPSSIEIRSGLHAGDLVVMGNRSGLQSGQQVRPKPTDIASALR